LVKNLYKPLLICAIVGLLFYPVLGKLAHTWYTDDNYSHGLLIPFIILYILWLNKEKFLSKSNTPAFFTGTALILLSIVMLWGGTAGAELFTQRIAFVVMLTGLVFYFWGTKVLSTILVPLLLLFLSIPLPTLIFNKIAFPLQLFASRCAVASMKFMDIPVVREGNIIELVPLGSTVVKRLEVVEACSGIRSLMTLLTLAVVYAYFSYPSGPSNRGPKEGFWSYGTLRSVLLVLSAFPIAILTNALRVSGTGILARYFGTGVADGFFHSFSGWAVYILALALLFSFGFLLDRIAGMITRTGREDQKKDRLFAKVAEGTDS
jgi:exosortase